MFQNNLNTGSLLSGVSTEGFTIEKKKSHVKAVDRTYAPRVEGKEGKDERRDQEEEDKKKRSGRKEDDSQIHPSDSTDELVRMFTHQLARNIKEVYTRLFKEEHQLLVLIHSRLLRKMGVIPLQMYSRLYCKHARLDDLRSKMYLVSKDFFEVVQSKTALTEGSSKVKSFSILTDGKETSEDQVQIDNTEESKKSN